MNLELKARIVEANVDIIDINGFKYNLHLIKVGQHDKFKLLVPIFDELDVGDCFTSNDWVLTQLGNSKPADLCIRMDKFDLITDSGFEESKYLNTKVIGMFLNSDKCFLRTIGPKAKPFYMATLKVKDDYGVSFENLIAGFGDTAKKLSTIKKGSVIECEATVKKKKGVEGYELAILKVDVLSEGISK